MAAKVWLEDASKVVYKLDGGFGYLAYNKVNTHWQYTPGDVWQEVDAAEADRLLNPTVASVPQAA